MFKFLQTYQKVNHNIIKLMIAELFLQLINSSFTLILNLYMTRQGYADHQIATYVSYRFMALVVFAIPFGLFIQNRRIKPILLLSAAALPVVSLLILEAITHGLNGLLLVSMIIWGVCFTANQIAILPFILRNTTPDTHTESISLNASIWGLATIVSGMVIYGLSGISATLFSDKVLLQLFALSGFAGVWFIWQMTTTETPANSVGEGKTKLTDYDWQLIAKAVVPTSLIAVGAGLSIPFMNLYFYHIFGLGSGNYALLGSITAVVVSLFSLQAPLVKRRFGYEAITGTQLLAIIALIMLGTAGFFGGSLIAFYLAAFCFIIRQPLMNLANPMSSQMTMYYVGKKNQELVSAITSTIWSGSWFFSALLFKYLRAMNLHYGYIIYLTAGFYLIGVVSYHLLIKDFRRRENLGLVG